MKKVEFVSVIVKLFGVYAIIESLGLLNFIAFLPGVFGEGKEVYPIWHFIAMFLPFFLRITVAVLLLAFSDKIARGIIREDGDMFLSGALSGREFQAICFSAAGVIVFVFGVPQIAEFITNLFLIKDRYASGQPVHEQYVIWAWRDGIGAVVQCGLAAVLFFRARGLANLWHRIQSERYVKVEE